MYLRFFVFPFGKYIFALNRGYIQLYISHNVHNYLRNRLCILFHTAAVYRGKYLFLLCQIHSHAFQGFPRSAIGTNV